MMIHCFIMCCCRDVAKEESDQAKATMENFIEDLGVGVLPDAFPNTKKYVSYLQLKYDLHCVCVFDTCIVYNYSYTYLVRRIRFVCNPFLVSCYVIFIFTNSR